MGCDVMVTGKKEDAGCRSRRKVRVWKRKSKGVGDLEEGALGREGDVRGKAKCREWELGSNEYEYLGKKCGWRLHAFEGEHTRRGNEGRHGGEEKGWKLRENKCGGKRKGGKKGLCKEM